MESSITYLEEVFLKFEKEAALVHEGVVYSYADLLKQIQYWDQYISKEGVENSSVVSITADFSLDAVALMFSLIKKSCVIVPLTSSVLSNKEQFLEIANVEFDFSLLEKEIQMLKITPQEYNPLILDIKEKQTSGLILFSSGSTGQPKAALHNFDQILEKFKVPRHRKTAISFLLYDHIGGINTLFYVLSNGGCVVTVADRSPDTVLKAIEKYKVELLPTSPTFINLILLSGTWKDYDLSSLNLVTYGTEPMPQSTLEEASRALPSVNFLQTYGLSEIGILRSKSESNSSLWVKIGGEGFETRVREGLLEVKAKSAMLGYLNAESPFTEDGWFKTGDAVEVKGEYFKILGRVSEIINVGGEKVYPAEIESVLLELDFVSEASVSKIENPITGQAVKATVSVSGLENKEAIKRMKLHCKDHLSRFKRPVKYVISEGPQYNSRFKKNRAEL